MSKAGKPREKHHRSIAKAVSWRMVGTMDTILLSLLFTGKIGKALQIGLIELFTKIFLFYVHERIWLRLKFGTREVMVEGVAIRVDRHYRSVVKGISWRVIGSIDTFWIALFVNRDSPTATQTALLISATEVLSKVGLFWLHERIWLRIKWGHRHVAQEKEAEVVEAAV